MKPHGVTYKKIMILIFTAVRYSYLASFEIFKTAGLAWFVNSGELKSETCKSSQLHNVCTSLFRTARSS
jgi:hypothetical protein